MNRVVRLGLAVLAAFNAWWGVWAVAAPRHFFDSFPGWGRHWAGGYPPFNPHLVTDLGATFLTLAMLLGAAAWLNDRIVTRVVLAGVLVFNGLHLAFHAVDHGTLTGTDLALSLAALAIGVLGPVVLLVLDGRS